MKTLNQWSLVLASVLVLLLSACEHNVSMESTIYPDGSLDRTIVLHKSDSGKIENNFMGVKAASGWDVKVEALPISSTEKIKKPEMNITFKKHFGSVEEANRHLNPETDAVFHVVSSFEKKNRWFYTYIEYRDTYRALNLFNAIPKEDYFTKEDFDFIKRLPAEGTPINKADSLYLAKLNEKIFDDYGSRTIFEEFFQHVIATMREQRIPSHWRDTLLQRKEIIYERFVADGEFSSIIENSGIPFSAPAKESIKDKTAYMERRLEFMSEAYSGKYVHSIKMPWPVIDSNADSVISNRLFWRPPVVKFLFSDYTMSATARKMNILPVALSALLVVVTIGLFFYQGKNRK